MNLRRATFILKSFVVLSIFVFFNSCGGGGGGSGIVTGDTYTGKSSQATVTKGNAQQIMQDAFLDGMSGTGFAAAFGAIEANQIKKGSTPIYSILLKPAKNIARIVTNQSYNELPRSISAIQTEPISENGECGGSISGSMQIDTSTGSMTGSFTFSSYCEMGTVSNGTVIFSGTVNTANGNLNITMTFKDVTGVSSEEDLNIAMNGTIIMVSTGSSDSMTMNIYVRDNSIGKTYWMENFAITDSSNADQDEMEISGKFYSPDYGYVTLSTQETFITLSDDYNPSEGILIATGAGGTKARLTALSSTTYKVEADTDGNGTYDWDSGVLLWEE